MPIKINSVNFDAQQFIYSLVDPGGNVIIDHVAIAMTTENTLAEMRTTAQGDALARKTARKAELQAQDAALQAQITALGGAGLP